MYLNLSKTVVNFYGKWNSELPVYKRSAGGVNLIENTPEDLLKVVDKIINVSTNGKYQVFLRKILISIKKLTIEHFPKDSNQQYDPDVTYLMVTEYITTLKKEIVRLKDKIIKLKVSCN